MKVKRQKKVHRYLNFYATNFGFRQPYQILVDGTICLAALKNKVTLKDQIPKYFDSTVKLLTTQCVIIETEKLGSAVFGAMLIVKQFPVHRCNHKDRPIVGSACLASMLKKNNPDRYIIASQDRELQNLVRKIPGAPLLYLHQKVPTLEKPSPASLEWVKNRMESRIGIAPYQEEILKELKKKTFGETFVPLRTKKRKAKGPNPLSCKKKKQKMDKTVENENSQKSKGELVKKSKTSNNAKVSAPLS